MSNFVDNLIAKMDVDDMIHQLNLRFTGPMNTAAIEGDDQDTIIGNIKAGEVGGVFGTFDSQILRVMQESAVEHSPHGIPLLLGIDAIHGHKEIFPVNIGLTASWNPDLIKRVAEAIAYDLALDGVNWNFAPMSDVSDNNVWGRIAELGTSSPLLASKVVEAMVKGFQGEELSPNSPIMACVKHVAAYGGVMEGLEYNTVDVSTARLFEKYLPPYKAGIEAGAGSLMSGFSAVNGLSSTGDKHLLTGIMRDLFGFEGFIVSDYGSIVEMVNHGLCRDARETGVLSLKAGVDMDMEANVFSKTLRGSLDRGDISKDDIKQACRRILIAKEKLGLFANPYKNLDNMPEKARLRREAEPQMRALARESAAETFVLLKKGVLPLEKKGKIALIGPLANDQKNMFGSWSWLAGDPSRAVSVLKGIKGSANETADILYAKGSNITDDPELVNRLNAFDRKFVEIDERSPEEMLAEAVEVANQADVVVAVVGEAQEMSGECSSRTDLGVPEEQKKLLRALKETGKPLVLLTMSGRPLVLSEEHELADSILHCWQPGEEAGNAIADVLFGDKNPSGKLPMDLPRSALATAYTYDRMPTGRSMTPEEEPYFKYKTAYLDSNPGPLYPFGFGESYTTFKYGDIRLSKDHLQGEEDVLDVSITIKNTGDREGADVPQIYLRDPVASMVRPLKVHIGNEKISLKPGEEREVTFQVTPEDLIFYTRDGEPVWEPGDFIIHVGPNSRDTQSVEIVWDKAPEVNFENNLDQQIASFG